MKPFSSSEIIGTWGAALLPFNRDDSVDFSALAAQVDAIADAGLDGIYTNGTAGEFHAQTEAEFDQISALVAERATARGLPFQLGVCHPHATVALERLRRIKALAPAAIQVILPDWVATTASESEAFLQGMAEAAAPIGLVLYTPGHAKKPQDLAAVAKLRSAVAGLVGVKMPDGNASWYAAMRRQLPNFSVFVPGHHLALGRLQGAHGSYSNVACLSPVGARRWQEQMERDNAGALAFQSRLLAFFQDQIAPLAQQGYCPAALDKALCSAGGWCPMTPRLRWPYRGVSADLIPGLAAAVRSQLPELF